MLQVLFNFSNAAFARVRLRALAAATCFASAREGHGGNRRQEHHSSLGFALHELHLADHRTGIMQ